MTDIGEEERKIKRNEGEIKMGGWGGRLIKSKGKKGSKNLKGRRENV